MRISHFFIERPAFAAVVAILITLVGAIAYPSLPVAQYPQIAPPTVTVAATYPGASAEVLADTVASPIETQINGVENMEYMSSQATGDGHLTITVTFRLGTDPNTAQVLVQNRVAVAEPQLPDPVRAGGVVVRKTVPDILLAVHMYSPDGTLDQQYISNYVGLHIRDRLLRIDGVGDIGSRAVRDYAMRIWIDPDRAAARNLTTDEVVNALRSHNLQVSTGAIGTPPFGNGGGAFQLNVQAEGRLFSADQFGDIVIRRDDTGAVVRIKDVGRVELGAADYGVNAYMSGYPAAAQGIQAQPGSNALKTADEIIATMNTLKKDFPPGLDYKIIYNPTEYVKASIEEVQKTLVLALILVVFVVMAFLQSWRAALIPVLAIPVSLVGSFAVMGAFGFSLNNLSLFGLVLAIGIVVDDAIVVVENVERHLRVGMAPKDAAHRTMDEVGGALVAIALVLSAVFVPTAFISGISGQFYRQFALTIATATLISLVVSLTLSPALAALIMRHEDHSEAKNPAARAFGQFAARFNGAFDALSLRYGAFTARTIRKGVLMLVLYGVLLVVTGWRLAATPQGFIPAQDQGNFLASIILPPGSSLQRNDTVTRATISKILGAKGIQAASVYVGVDAASQTTASNASQMYVIMDPFSKRVPAHLDQNTVLANVRKAVAGVVDADVRFIPPPPVRGIGTAGGWKLIIEDETGRGPIALEQATNAVAEAARKNPAISTAFVTFNTKTPRIDAEVDRQKAENLGVPSASIYSTLQTYLGSTFVNTFNLFGKSFQVIAQADHPERQSESDIPLLQTRAASGAMVPLGAVMRLKHGTGPYRVLRYNLYPSAEVQGDTSPGYSTGQAMQAMEEVARQTLPAGFGFEWTELAYEQKAAGNTAALTFLLAVVFVFLLLTALYESVTLPLAVILIVPMCLLAAITGVNIMGQDNNILTQIGLVVLIGLAAKNAILIVEFARQAEEQDGQDRWQAAIAAAHTRLRPILMTSVAFILGVAPLAFAAGAGAEMRQALGVGVFFGMIGVTVFGLVFTPVFYVLCRFLSDHIPKPPWRRKPPPSPPQPLTVEEG